MTTDHEPAITTGSAPQQGRLWSARADDWAELQEATARELYNAVIEHLPVEAGTALLDVGCGSGLFCALAAQAGASVSGADAAPGLVGIARSRTPEGDFRVADMEHLPFGDGAFGLVTAINAIHYAADPTAALREADRVAEPGAPIIVATWDMPQTSQAAAYIRALGPLLPERPAGTRRLGPLALSEDDVAEELIRSAGLQPGPWHSVPCPFIYPDHDTALRALLSTGPAQEAVEASGEDAVRDAIEPVLGDARNVFGGYRMENRYRYLVAEA